MALAVATNFFGLLPSDLYLVGTAVSTINGLLSKYNYLVNLLGIADEGLSVAIEVGLPIAEAAVYAATGSGLGSITIVLEVLEHLIALVIGYVVHVISMLVAVLWFIKYALMIGRVLGFFIPYIVFLLVIPRVRDVAVIPVALYLILGVALPPLGINTTHVSPVINIINETQFAPGEVGFVNVEVVDALGRPVPAVLCIGGYGFSYSETIGLPSGFGVIALPYAP